MDQIQFNIPYTLPRSIANVEELQQDASRLLKMEYVRKCEAFFEDQYPGYKALMTTSCTRALELVALAMDIQAGDEVIIASFNYVGVANAFANYGAELVFVDLNADTMSMPLELLKQAVTPKTKAVVAMHYGALAKEIEAISSFCEAENLLLVEDNAQGISTSINGKLLGSFGDFSAISFDRLKNVSCGEGGVLLCKEDHFEKIHIAFEKGTNKQAFQKGFVSSYQWVDKGSNFSMSEYLAAVLHPLLQHSEKINEQRRIIWNKLYDGIAHHADLHAYLPKGWRDAEHNGHIFYLKCNDIEHRQHLIRELKSVGISSGFHYTPLHSSQAGQVYRYVNKDVDHTTIEAEKLLRLPMHNYLSDDDIGRIVSAVAAILSKVNMLQQ